MANTLNLGTDGNWATKENSLLGYNSENGNYKPLPFDFTRASNGTFVNKSGLIETAASGVPRIDFSDSTSGALLLEPQRSNLLPYSSDFSQSNWVKVNNAIVSATKVISPDGTLNASQIIFDGTSRGRIEDAIPSLIQGVDYTVSVYARVASGTQIVNFGSVSDFSYTLTTEWQRLTSTEVENDTVGYPRLICNDAATIEIYGFQLEQGSYATSLINTQGSAVTRVQDVCNQTVPDGVIGQTEGVIFLDIKMPSVIQSNTTFSIGGGTSGEYAQLEIRSDLSINWRYRVGNGDYINANVGSYLGGDRLKLAFAYKNGDSILYKNGVSIATDTGSIVSNSWNNVDFSNYAGTGKLNADVNQTSLYNTRLSNSELAALTS
jgi:hypothetical protein